MIYTDILFKVKGQRSQKLQGRPDSAAGTTMYNKYVCISVSCSFSRSKTLFISGSN